MENVATKGRQSSVVYPEEAPVRETLYMIVEHFKHGDPAPVYQRFRDRGRMAPEGLNYISSWVDHDLTTCYQVMQTADRRLLDLWMSNWNDLVEFEVHPVITSAEAAERVASRFRYRPRSPACASLIASVLPLSG
jgi:Protein of unknown function (DUF3303)